MIYYILFIYFISAFLCPFVIKRMLKDTEGEGGIEKLMPGYPPEILNEYMKILPWVPIGNTMIVGSFCFYYGKWWICNLFSK